MAHRLIEALEKEYSKKELPVFKVGDTVRVGVRVDEGEGKFRTQMFEGIVIRKEGLGIRANFTVRRISFGEGVERKFPYHSPTVQKVELVRSGRVRRAKLYYLRDTTGKGGRIEEERRKDQPAASPAPATASA
jgi:large subunit ribosomal protein L19